MIEDVVGIDLGTTNSEIAVYREGRPEVLADERGRKIMPSVVGVSETGELLVGEEARNQFVLYPELTVRSIKRRMGSNDKVHLAGSEYTPQEISAMILKRLRAETGAGCGTSGTRTRGRGDASPGIGQYRGSHAPAAPRPSRSCNA